MKILHLVFHPNIAGSRVNAAWAKQIEASGKVSKTKYMYDLYGDFDIDVAAEQADLLAHDRIVFQFPFYWYSVPPLFKKWMDDVLTFNFAYGPKGIELKGKEMQIIVSVGGPKEAYSPGGYNNFSVTELLRPLQQTANLCKMPYLPPMYMHSSVAANEATIKSFGEQWVDLIDSPDLADPWKAQARIVEAAAARA